MKVYFLHSSKSTPDRSVGHSKIFQEKAEAQAVMRAYYDETIELLAFDTDTFETDHFCGCGTSSAVIIDGDNQYSWSIFEKKMPILSEIPGLADILVCGGRKD